MNALSAALPTGCRVPGGNLTNWLVSIEMADVVVLSLHKTIVVPVTSDASRN
jgi:hypothetical protein